MERALISNYKKTCLLQQSDVGESDMQVLHSTAWRYWWAFFQAIKIIIF